MITVFSIAARCEAAGSLAETINKGLMFDISPFAVYMSEFAFPVYSPTESAPYTA